ncbi:MAG: TolC family protein [Bacteroidaceae bacterium]|nr:TolC family protein [Bacteroidaceae bacterium]
MNTKKSSSQTVYTPLPIREGQGGGSSSLLGWGVGVLLSCFVLSSCGLYKNYERPADITIDGLYGQSEQAGDEQGMGAIGWRTFFTDPTLQGLIEKGLAQNASMQQIDIQIREAQEYLTVAKLAYVPSLVFTPQGQMSSWDWAAPSKTYTFPITASWQIGSLGSLRNAKKQADVAVAQTQVARQAVQQSLVANIANLYYTLCMLDAELAISEQTAANWRESVERTRQLMEAGRSNKAALAQTEANCYTVEASVLDLKRSITEAENALCTILGETPHHIDRQSLSTFTVPGQVNTGVPFALLSNRPDVKQAELKLASAFYGVNIATSAFYPSLNISGTLGFTNSAGTMVVNPGKWIWNAVAGLTQPIFMNGRLRAQKRVAVMQQEEAKIGFQQQLIAAGNEVNTAMVKLQTLQAKSALYDGQITALNDAVAATEALYTNNVSRSVNYLNVLTAQTGLLQAQLGQISNKLQTVQAAIELYQALGGGAAE